MNIDESTLEEALVAMRKAAQAGLARRGSVFSTGLTMSSGRAVGVIVEAALAVFRVSDGGDAWRDLVLNGYADHRPSAAEREKLQRACELHGVHWDAQRREVFGLAHTVEAVPEIATRVAATALSIDGWRAWYPPRQTRDVNKRRIVEHLVRLAPVRGWDVDRAEIVRGNVHSWAADAMLVRPAGDRGVVRAAVEISGDRSAEHLMQRIVGFLYDVRSTGLVVVVSKRIDEYLQGSAELRDHVAVVPRLPRGTPRAIVEAAERVAIRAA